MADRGDQADRTEPPTRRRLRDARRRGEVAQSREAASTAALAAWLALGAAAVPPAYREVAALFEHVFAAIAQPVPGAIGELGVASVRTALVVSLPLLAGAAMAGLAAGFVQVGGLFAARRVKPDASRLDPVQGLARMFSLDNLVELAKAAIKTLLLAAIFAAVAWHCLGALVRLPEATPAAIGAAIGRLGLTALGLTVAVFAAVSLADWAYQRHAFLQRHRMSRREIRRELREDEGDPQLKARRRQLHQEWATRNVLEAVRTASVVVVNPTHVAVALRYEAGETAVPVVAAKGEDHLAQLIRETAESAGVPVLRSVALARGLNERVEVDDYIPAEFFAAAAEVLRWAASIRDPH